MSNIIRSTTNLAIHIAREYIVPGGIIVDATCGNGHDTLALAKAARSIAKADRADAKADRAGANCIQPHILAFDIQQEAIDATGRLLMSEGFVDELASSSIRLICDSHENMSSYVDAANLIVFNLGYLPGGDKTVTTKADSTLQAINASLVLLARDGAVCITMYSGHEEGAKEKAQLLDFARNLDSHEFHVAYVNIANQPNNPPELLVISRKI